MTGYLTPDTIPADTICRVLFIPNNQEFIANVTGALQVLTNPDNWTKYGTLTPEEAANALVDMFDLFCYGAKGCKLIGEIVLWAGSSAPDDQIWLLCNGSHYSNVDYPDLYNVIGTTYGGTGATDFAIPNMHDRVPMGAGGSFGLGATGGEFMHTLTWGEMPLHSHTYVPPVINIDVEAPGVPDPVAAGLGFPAQTGDAGANEPHNNLQPYLTLNYYIVAG